jgi:hypothetical protein
VWHFFVIGGLNADIEISRLTDNNSLDIFDCLR